MSNPTKVEQQPSVENQQTDVYANLANETQTAALTANLSPRNIDKDLMTPNANDQSVIELQATSILISPPKGGKNNMPLKNEKDLDKEILKWKCCVIGGVVLTIGGLIIFIILGSTGDSLGRGNNFLQDQTDSSNITKNSVADSSSSA